MPSIQVQCSFLGMVLKMSGFDHLRQRSDWALGTTHEITTRSLGISLRITGTSFTEVGDVYVLVDEESLNVNSHHEKNFRDYQRTEHHSTDARRSDLEVLLEMILEGGLAPSVQARLIRWLVCGRLGK